ERGGGFRGIQTKGLVDLVQLECLSRSSSVLRIINGGLEGKIWIQDGEVIDAISGDLTGETAFREIFSWRTGNFEIYPPEPGRPRTITMSYHALLLDSAQAMDEALREQIVPMTAPQAEAGVSPLTALSRFEGVEFVLSISK